MPLASCFNKRWVDFSRAVGTTLYQYVYQFYHSEHRRSSITLSTAAPPLGYLCETPTPNDLERMERSRPSLSLIP